MDKLSKNELLKLIYAYDEYIQQANEENKYSTGWMPTGIEEFYQCELKLIGYMDQLSEDGLISMDCQEYMLEHVNDTALYSAFCELCEYFPDDCQSELPISVLRDMLSQLEEGD